MVRTVLTVGLLTLSATPEPRPLPPDIHAVQVYEGSARLLVGDAPETHLTLLPRGVFFDDEGYQRLNIATQQVQANLRAVEARLKDYEAAALVPCPDAEPPPATGWSTKDVLLVGAVGVVFGVVGGVVLVGLRAH